MPVRGILVSMLSFGFGFTQSFVNEIGQIEIMETPSEGLYPFLGNEVLLNLCELNFYIITWSLGIFSEVYSIVSKSAV